MPLLYDWTDPLFYDEVSLNPERSLQIEDGFYRWEELSDTKQNILDRLRPVDFLRFQLLR